MSLLHRAHLNEIERSYEELAARIGAEPPEADELIARTPPSARVTQETAVPTVIEVDDFDGTARLAIDNGAHWWAWE